MHVCRVDNHDCSLRWLHINNGIHPGRLVADLLNIGDDSFFEFLIVVMFSYLRSHLLPVTASV